MKRDGSRAKVYSGCNLMVLERTSRPDMRQVPWGTCQMTSDQAGNETAGGGNCAGIEAGFHPFCEDKVYSGQDSIAGHDGFTKAEAILEGSDFGKSGYHGKRQCGDCFASVVVVLIFRLSGSVVFGETAIFVSLEPV